MLLQMKSDGRTSDPCSGKSELEWQNGGVSRLQSGLAICRIRITVELLPVALGLHRSSPPISFFSDRLLTRLSNQNEWCPINGVGQIW